MPMNEEQAKALILRAGAHTDERTTNMALAALAIADEERGTFRTSLATTHWRLHDNSTPAAWQAILVTHSTEVQARFETEEKAIVWLANRLGAIIWAHEYATRDFAEVVIPSTPPAR